ncbi:MAG: EAL domain-containing protein [Pseudomonadota bacterium]
MSALFSGLRTDPEKRIRVAYRLALLALAVLMGLSYFALNTALERGRLYAVTFKDINNERVLSQRIVLLGQNAFKATDPVKRQLALLRLDEAVGELKHIHAELAGLVNENRNRNATAKRVHEIFFGWPNQLDAEIRSLISNAENLQRLAITAPREAAAYLAPMEEIALTQVLPALDQVSETYRLQTRDSIAQFERIHVTILLLSLCLLALVGMFLFRPLAKQIGQRNRELIAARDEMRQAANHDSLTGLANRDFAIAEIQKITQMQAGGQNVDLALLLLDLDDFKIINDSFGHLYGDKLLHAAAERMRLVVDDRGVACRMGGDEFLLLIRDASTQSELAALATRILRRLDRSKPLTTVVSQASASMGIARFPSDGNSAEELLAAADVALYAAKRSGKGTFRFFNEELQRQLNDYRALEKDIDKAIAEQEFHPVFQPQVDISTGQVTGIEVLVRWHHPERGILRPAEFLNAAAGFGRMPDITRLVLDKALHTAAEWQASGIAFGRVGINLSSHDLLWTGIFRSIAQSAQEHSLAYDRISVEVVESVAIDSDNEQSALALYELRRLGIQIEVDDFGTGFASLSHLNRDLFDRVKIDRQFVTGIDGCERERIIVDSIIRLANALNVKVIAEGVETQGEIDTLVKLGCQEFQGNAIAPPMPAEVARAWLLTHQRISASRPAEIDALA